ncbi:hypothetical protein [Streptosporangium amethystogenes]|uniref:hypothetical protein n=1 Tax=Streptosporangium amethystogenes TaxID=2002 RepID=UPI0012FC9394|nr:hypothetical protein [Streptosporangium amethystogenes]
MLSLHDSHLPLLSVLPGVEPERLARETARRMEHVAGWRRLDLSMRARLVPLAIPVPTMLGSDCIRRAVADQLPRRPGTSKVNEVLAPAGGGPALPRPLLALRSLPPQEADAPDLTGG